MSLAADSIVLADAIDKIRKRHRAKKWPRHNGMKADLLEFLKESSWLLRQSAKTLEGKP